MPRAWMMRSAVCIRQERSKPVLKEIEAWLLAEKDRALPKLKMVPEVCRIFCATANPTEIIVAETEQGRGVLGVVDGFSPKGIEDDGEIKWRKDFLRKIGYKQ